MVISYQQQQLQKTWNKALHTVILKQTNKETNKPQKRS